MYWLDVKRSATGASDQLDYTSLNMPNALRQG
ncbi:hypothetical protein BXY70_0402 [Roseovarius halotolerans]|uniref:Uncharacterized protein n=1 Tax=Roseovarius halotolerans TaxID=505353 RepID=A0A1X6YL79_9RHOB|nr:hypothetical protein BXY70_0402 [Roseovarius halotolerans]SLN24046.1 hypothetical protein ROH8110_00993 [Roseovarius halotolerans]